MKSKDLLTVFPEYRVIMSCGINYIGQTKNNKSERCNTRTHEIFLISQKEYSSVTRILIPLTVISY